MTIKQVLILLLGLLPLSAFGILKTTTEEIGRPYTAIEGLCFFEQFAQISFKSDPLQGSIMKAIERIEEKGKALGADAFVGFDVDFANRTEKDEGRVLICGTFVKFDDE